MKRFTVFILMLVCVLSLAGCEQRQANEPGAERTPTNAYGFSEFLDAENFVPGLSQGEFTSQMEQYKYQGKKITDIAAGYFYDGAYGGGYKAGGEQFGFHNDYTASEDRQYATYSNSFYTKTKLGGLTLPHDISFKDTLDKVLKKLEVNIDPYGGFVSDADDEGVMTLQSNSMSSLKLTNCRLLPGASEKPTYAYKLTYTESYQVTRADGREATATRSITMSFADDNKLGMFAMSVQEYYKIDQGQ